MPPRCFFFARFAQSIIPSRRNKTNRSRTIKASFDLSGSQGIPEYNPFADSNLKQHFSNPRIRHQLRKQGVVEETESHEFMVVPKARSLFYSRRNAAEQQSAEARRKKIGQWEQETFESSPGKSPLRGKSVLLPSLAKHRSAQSASSPLLGGKRKARKGRRRLPPRRAPQPRSMMLPTWAAALEPAPLPAWRKKAGRRRGHRELGGSRKSAGDLATASMGTAAVSIEPQGQSSAGGGEEQREGVQAPCVLVTGTPGVGKSTICSMLLRELRRRATYIDLAGCSGARPSPLSPTRTGLPSDDATLPKERDAAALFGVGGSLPTTSPPGNATARTARFLLSHDVPPVDGAEARQEQVELIEVPLRHLSAVRTHLHSLRRTVIVIQVIPPSLHVLDMRLQRSRARASPRRASAHSQTTAGSGSGSGSAGGRGSDGGASTTGGASGALMSEASRARFLHMCRHSLGSKYAAWGAAALCPDSGSDLETSSDSEEEDDLGWLQVAASGWGYRSRLLAAKKLELQAEAARTFDSTAHVEDGGARFQLAHNPLATLLSPQPEDPVGSGTSLAQSPGAAGNGQCRASTPSSSDTRGKSRRRRRARSRKQRLTEPEQQWQPSRFTSDDGTAMFFGQKGAVQYSLIHDHARDVALVVNSSMDKALETCKQHLGGLFQLPALHHPCAPFFRSLLRGCVERALDIATEHKAQQFREQSTDFVGMLKQTWQDQTPALDAAPDAAADAAPDAAPFADGTPEQTTPGAQATSTSSTPRVLPQPQSPQQLQPQPQQQQQGDAGVSSAAELASSSVDDASACRSTPTPLSAPAISEEHEAPVGTVSAALVAKGEVELVPGRPEGGAALQSDAASQCQTHAMALDDYAEDEFEADEDENNEADKPVKCVE